MSKRNKSKKARLRATQRRRATISSTPVPTSTSAPTSKPAPVFGSNLVGGFVGSLPVWQGLALVVAVTCFPALSLLTSPDRMTAAVPQVMIEVLHTVYTCVSFRKDTQVRQPAVSVVYSFFVPLLTTLAGSILAAVVLEETPSFISNWRTVVPYRLVLPWLVVTLLPQSVFQLYSQSTAGTGARIVVNTHEALNKYKGLISALRKARHMPLAAVLSFVAARGAASSAARAIEAVVSHPVPGVMRKQLLGTIGEHLRYLVLCVALIMATSVLHPARSMVQAAHNIMCPQDPGALMQNVCIKLSQDHIAQGTYSMVLLYLLYVYVAKAIPTDLALSSTFFLRNNKDKVA